MGIQDYFSTVEDPRVMGRCKHKLSDILVIAPASYLCGGEDYESMHELCLERGESLRPLVELPNGCPSVDTFERVLQRIDPHSLYACLEVYGKELSCITVWMSISDTMLRTREQRMWRRLWISFKRLIYSL